MEGSKLTNIVWPPTYYILRDRIPFFFTVIYVFRGNFPKGVLTAWGYFATLLTSLGAAIATSLYIHGKDMNLLAGIHWSAASPIEWFIVILGLTIYLNNKGVHIFESYYMAFLTAEAGGWLYEFMPLLFQSRFNYIVFFKINSIKVFFFEFQVLCLPILLYIIYKSKIYKPNILLYPTFLFMLGFDIFNYQIINLAQQALFYSYNWVVRIPTILFLVALIIGIKGNKPDIWWNKFE